MSLEFLTPQMIIFNFVTSLLFFMLLASFCGPFIALVTERLFAARGKVFYDKLAHQTARMTFWVGFFTVDLFIILSFILGFWFMPELFEKPYINVITMFICLPAVFLVLVAIYLYSWNTLRNTRSAHILIGFASSIAALLSIFALLLLVYIFQSPLPEFAEGASLKEVVSELLQMAAGDPSFWIFLVHTAASGLGAAGALSLIWLILRRYKDDFGRDYYVFATHYSARWAVITTLIGLVLAASLTFYLKDAALPELGETPPHLLYGLAYGLPVLACLLWGLIIKSPTPLRHRPGAFLACICLLGAMFAQIMCYTSMTPMP